MDSLWVRHLKSRVNVLTNTELYYLPRMPWTGTGTGDERKIKKQNNPRMMDDRTKPKRRPEKLIIWDGCEARSSSTGLRRGVYGASTCCLNYARLLFCRKTRYYYISRFFHYYLRARRFLLRRYAVCTRTHAEPNDSPNVTIAPPKLACYRGRVKP